jgi:hypothetical protein
MTLRKRALLEQQQFLEALQKIIVVANILPTPQRDRRNLIRSGRASDAKIDNASRVLKRSATMSGAWFGSITPPAPTRMFAVTAAIWPIMISGAELAIDGRL